MLGKHSAIEQTSEAQNAPQTPATTDAAASRIVNLTERVVISEASGMLSSPDYMDYRQLFSSDSLRDWLVRYAMRRIDSFCVVIGQGEAISRQEFWAVALIQRPYVRQILHEGIQFVNRSFRKRQRQFGILDPDVDCLEARS